MKQNKIKAVEMVRQMRDKQYEQTKEMSTEEKIAFYQESAKIFLEKLTIMVDASKNRSYRQPV